MIGRKRGLSSLPRNARGGCAYPVAVLHCEQGLAHNKSARGMMAEYPFDGGVLCHEEQRKGDPILFIHGMTMSSRFFTRQLDWLTRHHYRGLTLDLRCHGRSLKVMRGYTTPTYAQDDPAFIDDKGPLSLLRRDREVQQDRSRIPRKPRLTWLLREPVRSFSSRPRSRPAAYAASPRRREPSVPLL